VFVSGPAMIVAALRDFVRMEVVLPRGRTKVVILDEADNLTEEAQHVIVRYMKLQEVACSADSSAKTRDAGVTAAATTAVTFILACNDVSKVIKALQSHCRVFAFACLTPGEVAARVRGVAAAVGLNMDDDAANTLAGTTGGDMREALAVLQAACGGLSTSAGTSACGGLSTSAGTSACGGLSTSGLSTVTRALILDSTDKPDPEVMHAILRDVIDGSGLLRAMQTLTAQAADGRDAVNVSNALFQASVGGPGAVGPVTSSIDLADFAARVDISSELARCHARVTGGVPSLLQLYGCLSKVWCALHVK